MSRSLFLLAMLMVCTWPATVGVRADILQMPSGAKLTAERVSELDRFEAPVAVFDGATVPSIAVEGRVARQAWRIESAGLTPLQVIVPLREQLLEQGYDIAFECAAARCGGFDFRFKTEVLPGPNMFVNISRYLYLTALKGEAEAPSEVVAVLASVTESSSYVQVIAAQTRKTAAPLRPARQDAAPVQTIDLNGPGDIVQKLMTDGRVILPDLEFSVGTSNLGLGPFASLELLADMMRDGPEIRMVLVGHTDTIGGLAPNLAVSRARAKSVRDRMIADYGVDASRLEADGVAYLAPVASNLTAEGRAQNRRVEVILLSRP